MKKFIGKFAFIAALVCLSSLAACGTQKSEKQVDVAYTVGTYSGYRVDLVQILGVEAAAVIVDYEVGGVYIASLPDPSWEYVVEESDDERIYLTDAYLIGIISRADLLAIADAEEDYFTHLQRIE